MMQQMIDDSHVPYKVGGLYLVQNDDMTFGIAKIIAVDEGGVHLVLYANTYTAAPDYIDPDTLLLGGDEENEKWGISHFPLAYESIAVWRLAPIGFAEVRNIEQQAYLRWKKEDRGYW